MSELQVHSVEKNKTRILYPQGFINAHTVPDFERSIQTALEDKEYRILINCQSLSYINSSGLGVLMGAIEEIQENEGFLRLSNMNETIFHIFDTLGFTHLFQVFDSEEQALASDEEAKEKTTGQNEENPDE